MKRARTVFGIISAGLLLCSLTGCGVGTTPPVSRAAASAGGTPLRGSLHGGQQPVGGVSLQLYAVGNSGYGSAFPYASGSSLLGNTAVTTNAAGEFDLETYTCPTPDTLVYLVGTGGYPVVGRNANAGLALMAPLGACGNLQNLPYVSINELTTVAAVWALAPFMAANGTIGTTPTNQTGLVNAFTTVNKLVNVSTGKLSGPALPADALLPLAELNSLGNIMAVCVNSAGGVAGDGSPCGSLYSLAPAADLTSPVNTITAALNMAHAPAQNTLALYQLSLPASPFQPTLASPPTDWTVAIKHRAGGSVVAPAGIAADQQGRLWINSSGSSSIVALDTTGAVLSGSQGYASGKTGGTAITVDQVGCVWASAASPGSLVRLDNSGTTIVTGGGLASTSAIAVDRMGFIWAVGTGSVISTFNQAGVAYSPSKGFGAGAQAGVQSIAFKPR